MNKKELLILPFAPEGVVGRMSSERVHDDAFTDVPALAHIAAAALTLGNKLGLSAFNALFYETTADDPGVRALQVELAMIKHGQASEIRPDLDYFTGAKPAPGQQELAAKDDWMEPPR